MFDNFLAGICIIVVLLKCDLFTLNILSTETNWITQAPYLELIVKSTDGSFLILYRKPLVKVFFLKEF